MKRLVVQHLYKYGARYLASALAALILIKWINREPRLPDPLAITGVDAMELFEDTLKGDGLYFTWAHAVNSSSKLQSALKSQVHGIEADVVLKNEGTDKQELLPIMAHPPNFQSDLTLRSFLHETILSRSAIKLDFKSMSSVELSLQMLRQLKGQIKVPVLLNADIIRGPGGATEPAVPASSFLRKVSSGFSQCTLSLGWTTTLRRLEPYSWSHVYNMFKVLRPEIRLSQRVTFPVNASLLKNSVPSLLWLCEQFDASLTIWQSQPEAPVDISELVYFRSKLPKNRIYYDLQPDTMSRFLKVADDKSLLTKEHRVYEDHTYQPKDWILKVSNLQSSDLKVGGDSVWLSGPEAQLTSVAQISAHGKHLVIKGAVYFMSRYDNGTYNANLQIFVFGKDHLMNHPSGIRCSVSSTGRIALASDHLHDTQIYKDAEVGLSATSCYQFELSIIEYKLSFSVSAPKLNCNTMQGLLKPKTLEAVIDTKERVEPFPIILRNSKSNGYAIIQQMKVSTS